MNISRFKFLCLLVVSRGVWAQTTTRLELPNHHWYTEYLESSGQPSRDQLIELKKSGFVWVVNLSPKNVPGAIRDEQQIVEAANMGYVSIPVDWDKPSMDALEKFFAFMDQHRGQKILVHCWVNGRSSAFVYAYRTIREKAPEDMERDVLTKIWEKNPGYELRNMPQWQQFLQAARQRYSN